MPIPRFVELIRVSSAGQAERDTPEDQRRALDRLAKTRPGRLVERIDHGAAGLSGAADLAQRPDLQRLATLSRERAFDELRVRHLDRLTRHDDPRERFAIYGMVADAQAVIVDAGGHVVDPATEIGEVDYFLQTWASARERRKIIERTVTARKRLAAEGRPMTTIPYGRRYDHATGEWSTDPREMTVYRRIFAEVIGGTSLHRLAARLNAEGLTAPKGGLWEASSIRQMIRKPAALGRITSYGHPIACPPVVDDVTQRRAIAAMRRGRTKSGPPGKHRALLRRIAVCGVCGSTMHVVVSGTKSTGLYYRCANAKGRRGAPPTCSARRHHQVAEIDAGFLAAVREAVRDPDRLLRQAAPSAADPGQARGELDAIKREIERLDRREENLVRMRSQGEVRDEMWRRQSAEIGRLRAAAEERRDAIVGALEAAERLQGQAQDARAAIESMRRRLAKAGWEEWRRLIETVWQRQEGTWIRIHPGGQIEARGGAIRLERKPGTETSQTSRIPLALVVG
jgi:DNA invertase Pin-like site-specific DNA recombinase